MTKQFESDFSNSLRRNREYEKERRPAKKIGGAKEKIIKEQINTSLTGIELKQAKEDGLNPQKNKEGQVLLYPRKRN